MDAAPEAVHVGAFATPSGAAATTDPSLRRRRERSVSSDASDAYVEHLLRPNARRVKPEQSNPAPPAAADSDLGAATSDEHVQPTSEEGSVAEAQRGDRRADAPPQEANAGPGEDKMCRICFDGPDEELGKLFSPCLCRGTVRLVALPLAREILLNLAQLTKTAFRRSLGMCTRLAWSSGAKRPRTHAHSGNANSADIGIACNGPPWRES